MAEYLFPKGYPNELVEKLLGAAFTVESSFHEFLFLRGGDERDVSPVGRAAYAAALRDLSIHCRDGFDGLRATNIEIARVERGYFLSSSSFSAAFWRE